MTELETEIAGNRAAVEAFAATARSFDGAAWTTPPAPGAWSPGQITEHLALVYEYNRQVVHGTAKGLPFPLGVLLRPLLRRIVVDNTIRAGRFTRKGRAPSPFRPGAAPAAPVELVRRLRDAVDGFEADLRSRPRSEHIDHPVFGRIRVADWTRLQAIHARHHHAQLQPRA